MKNIFATLGLLAISASAIAQIEIYNEDFEAGIPVTYTIVDNDGLTPNTAVSEYTTAWISKTDPLDAMNSTASSTSYFAPIGKSNRWLITPSIALGTFGNFLFWDALSHDPSFPDGYRVLASRTDTQLSSFTDTLFLVFAELADEWHTRSVDLSQIGLDGESVHFAFINETNNGFKLYLDNIRVEKENTSSLINAEANKLTIYPNPAHDYFTVSGIYDNVKINVLGIDGKVVLSSKSIKVDISSLSPGKYFIELITKGEILRTQLIKN